MITVGKETWWTKMTTDERRFIASTLLLSSAFFASACKQLPEIPITTPEPLQVNLNMRLDVYQYRGDEPDDKEASKALSEANTRMRNRMSEIFRYKEPGDVGENHRGLLEIRQVPASEGDAVKKAVADENTDRMLVMRRKAAESNRTLQEIQDEQWKLQIGQASDIHWIEVPGTNPGTFKWMRADAYRKAVPASAEKPAGTSSAPAAESEKKGEAKAIP